MSDGCTRKNSTIIPIEAADKSPKAMRVTGEYICQIKMIIESKDKLQSQEVELFSERVWMRSSFGSFV